MLRTLPLILVAFATPVIAQPGPGNFPTPPQPISIAPIVPPEWRLLSEPAVLKDLDLSPAQNSALTAIRSLDALPSDLLDVGTLGLVPRGVVRAVAAKAPEGFVTNWLTKGQRARLRQIAYQLKEREFGAHAAFVMAAKDVGLREDQVEDVMNIKVQRVEEIAKLVTSGERFDKVRPKVEGANADTVEKMTEMLTRSQRERLKDLRGQVFAGKVDFVGPLDSLPAPRYPKELFGLYDLEVLYLWLGEDLGKELALTNAQKNQVSDARERWSEEVYRRTRGTPLPGDIARGHDVTAKLIDTVLSKEQRGRLHEIMMQRRERVSPEAMCGHPAAVAVLKLSPVQLQKLSEGQGLADVLTAEQQAARGRLLGAPFDLPLLTIDYLVPAPKGSAKPMFASAFARRFLFISDRLKLSDDQIKKLRELAEDEPKFFDLIRRELSFADTPPVIGAGRGFTPGGAVAERYRAAVEEQCFNVLDDRQKSIARQIYGQRKR